MTDEETVPVFPPAAASRPAPAAVYDNWVRQSSERLFGDFARAYLLPVTADDHVPGGPTSEGHSEPAPSAKSPELDAREDASLLFDFARHA